MTSKRLSIMTAFLLLSACAAPTTQYKAPLSATIEIMQPKVDLPYVTQPRGMTFNVEVSDKPELNTVHIVSQGVHTAIECNAERTECKHAAVLPVVRYTLTRTGLNSARLQGTFIVTVGREVTDKISMTGVNAEFTTTISPDVGVIEEGTFSYPFSTELKLGQPFVVPGRLATQASFDLRPAVQFSQPR